MHDWFEHFFEWCFRLEACEQQRPPIGELDCCEVVRFRWKIFYVFKFRHVLEFSVETEATAVITAAKKFFVARAFANDVAAMGADVAHEVKLVLGIAGEDEGLIEGAFEEGEWVDGSGDFDHGVIADELPASGEGFSKQPVVIQLVVIDAFREGRGLFYVGVYGEVVHSC